MGHVCFLNFRNCPHFKLPLFFRCTPWKENWYFFVCILEKNKKQFCSISPCASFSQVLTIIQLKIILRFIFHWQFLKLDCEINGETKTSFDHFRFIYAYRFSKLSYFIQQFLPV